jgi:diguanylate cyclase (GGDEF)-like protein
MTGPTKKPSPLYITAGKVSLLAAIPLTGILLRTGKPPSFNLLAVVAVAIGYLLVELCDVRLTLGRSYHHHYKATEVPLIAGAILLGPIVHVSIRLVATFVGTILRRYRGDRYQPLVGPAFGNAGIGTLEVASFTGVLAAFNWSFSLSGLAPVHLVAGWVVYSLVWEAVMTSCRVLRGESFRETFVWTRFNLGLVLSFITMIGALTFSMAISKETHLLIPTLVIGLVCILGPLKFGLGLLARAEAHRSLDHFFVMLQTTSAENVSEALDLACSSAQSTSAELFLLERPGHYLDYDVVHHITAAERKTITVAEIPVWLRRSFEKPVSVWPNQKPDSNTFAPKARTEIVCPLVANGTPIGMLVLHDQLDHSDLVDLSDVEVAKRLAQHLSLWLQQDRLLTSLRNEAFNDPLTGLLNRRGFNEQWLELKSRGYQRIVALAIDLDNFKEVNTHAGHGGGDQVLIETAERLRAALPPRTIIARFGGDEFAVLIPGIREEATKDAYEFGLMVRQTLSRRFDVDGSLLTVGGSVGVALWPDHGDDLTAVLKAADAALYAAKNDPEIGVSSQAFPNYGSDTGLLINAHRLEQALDENRIKIFYQPLIDMTTCQVAGFEALVRWQDGDQLVTPDRFIALAERSGHIHKLTNFVMHHAFAATKQWQQQLGRPISISINVSPVSIGNLSVLDGLDIELLRSGLDPDCVRIEVTESRIIHDTLRCTVHLKNLKKKGVHISLDDFGTGASTHQWLTVMQPDEIKIDRSFVRTMNEKHGNGIVKTHVFMAELLGMNTVAEGIETVEQFNQLRAYGVKLGQGFLLARPMPEDTVQTWLHNEEPHLQTLLTLAESLPTAGNNPLVK